MSATSTTEINVVELEPKHAKAWDETLAAITWHCPAFTHIMYSLLDHGASRFNAIFTDSVSVAATDGKSLLLNPTNFFKLSLPRRVFVVAHEISHVIFEHIMLGYRCQVTGKVTLKDGSSLPYIHQLMNAAMDYVINDLLIKSKVGEFPSDGEFKGLHDPNIGTANDDIMSVYAKLYKDAKSKGQIKDVNIPGGGDHGGGFCEHLKPGAGTGKDPHDTMTNHDSGQVQTAVAAAANAAKLMGKLPEELERLLGEVVDPKVDWRDHIRALMARRLGAGGYDWRRADRRLIVRDLFAPSRSGYGCELVVCAIDTSGSISQKELDTFFGELAGILEDVKPRVVQVVWCDARVHGVDEIDSPSDLRHLKMKGGGGTDFRPVFDEIEKMNTRPDALVYMTDMYGSFPQSAPMYPVIWASISQGIAAPFGDVVEIPR